MEPDLQAALNFDFKNWISENDRPGVIAAVLSASKVTSWASAGRMGTGTDARSLTPTTAFYVASLAKQFTAACVTICETSGLVDLDASIRGLLPELPSLFDPITPRHLLHHLGGLPHGGSGGISASPDGASDWRDGLGLWDLIELLAREPRLLATPGERYSYSNCGYWLLAGAVQRASGQSFAGFAHQQLFAPLGMVGSRFRNDPDTPQPDLAEGHEVQNGRYAPVMTRFHGVGDGGLLTTVEDLAIWDEFWAGRSSLGPSLPMQLLEQGKRNDGRALVYARGVSVRLHRGQRIISHGGSFLGYQAKLVRFPDQDFSVCALSNAGDLDVDGLCMKLADKAIACASDGHSPTWAHTFRDDALVL